MASHPHKPIFYPSNFYDGSNTTRLTWIGNQFENHTTQHYLECHQYADHVRVINRRHSVLGIIHNLLGVAVWCKVQIQPAIASDSTDWEIRCMYKAVRKNKVIRRYMRDLSLYTGAISVHWEDNTNCISVVEAKRVTPRVKHIDIPVCFLQEQFDNGIFISKYEKSSVRPEYMCTKPCSGPIINQSNKWMTGFRFYPTSEIEHYHFMRLHEFIVK